MQSSALPTCCLTAKYSKAYSPAIPCCPCVVTPPKTAGALLSRCLRPGPGEKFRSMSTTPAPTGHRSGWHPLMGRGIREELGESLRISGPAELPYQPGPGRQLYAVNQQGRQGTRGCEGAGEDCSTAQIKPAGPARV